MGQTKKKNEPPSKIASPTPGYASSAPDPVMYPTHPEVAPPASPAFTFTPGEKKWLVTTNAAPLVLHEESIPWAGFTMLYSLGYWESDLDSIKELGIINTPPIQREYKRLFNIVSDLVELITRASSRKPIEYISKYNQKQTQETFGFTYQTAFDFINRFSSSWRNMPQYFPWEEFDIKQSWLLLGKLLEFLHRLKGIMASIRANNEQALKDVEEFLRDISPLGNLMERLSEYSFQQNKSKPIPWYVAGEVKEIAGTHLVVTVERSGYEDEERTIPRDDFPEESPQVGQHFFAVIEKDQPEKLLEIEPLPVRKESFEDILRSLFGKEAYEKISARWEQEQS